MGAEIVEFAKEIDAIDLKDILEFSEFSRLFKQRNYFLLKDNFLIIKISRSKIRSFWGFGKRFFDLFNTLTEKSGDYYFVALESSKSGGVLSKKEIKNQISNGLLSYSENQKEFKINSYNIKDQNSFTSIDGFLRIIGAHNKI